MIEPPPDYKLNQNGGIYKVGTAYPVELRWNFIHDWLKQPESNSKMSLETLSVEHRISIATAYNWINAYTADGRVEPLARGKLRYIECATSSSRFMPSDKLWGVLFAGGSDPWVNAEDNLEFFAQLLVSLAPHERTTCEILARHLRLASGGNISWTAEQNCNGKA